MDSLDHFKCSNTLDQMIEDGATNQPTPQKQMWSEQKQAAVHEEIRRMSQLPARSTYVSHRLRVLNKILQLISIQRTAAQEEELELLFAGLSL
ncbi:uncharacterized protein G2W53_011629 [Senna tora]|uniref:Uncharacterized protein n=1 Tax=Senna tora TaxID=362788 RepID=A0A834X333_9FABA|nr:uncharacterized protein G2W53_011629 [Senna tora]